jgi:hypothetical protein
MSKILEQIKSFSNTNNFKVEESLDRFTANRKKSQSSNKYGIGMDIKESKIQIGLDKDGGRNCFTNIAVK